MMTTEVTQGMWQEVMGTTIHDLLDLAGPYSSLSGVGSTFPVYLVSWNDCQEFIRKLNEMDSLCIYRLPSEAEWEYARRAGTTTRFYWGDEPAEADDYAWLLRNSNDQIHPVGLKLSNSWGLYDMVGNVGEWCQDNCQDSYHDAPTDGSAWVSSVQVEGVQGKTALIPIVHSSDSISWIHSGTIARRILGGCFKSCDCLIDHISSLFPEESSSNNGFRIVRSNVPGAVTMFTPEPLFVKSDCIITDMTTYLQWRVAPDILSWYEAQDWVHSLGSDWRMPSVEELDDLPWDLLLNSPFFGEHSVQPFEGLSDPLWSGDTEPPSTAWIFYINMHDYGPAKCDINSYRFGAVAFRSPQ
jgi:hypothetical protein